MSRRSRTPQFVWTAVCLLAISAALAWVDLSPRVEGDFFFSPDDPQLQATEQISDSFPSSQQILVRAASSDVGSDSYLADIRELTATFAAVPGIASVNSISTDRASTSPLWGRVLLPPGGQATNLVLLTDGADAEVLVPALEEVIATSRHDDLVLQMSGVPVIVELIRRSLFRDLVVFSSAALVVFGLLIGLVYRQVQVVVGTLAASGLACSVTLVLNQVVGLSIGLLTANIVTIVFVLTLSHVVFLTANSRRLGPDKAVRATLPGSFWAMITTLLGFLSLTLASARPLRELGLAGAIGAAVAIVVAYVVYPAFLPEASSTASAAPAVDTASSESKTPRANGLRIGAFAAVVLLVGVGIFRVDTDPGLLTYFAPGSELREGLELIDKDGGSSTLDIVVRDAAGARLDNNAGNDKMWAFQDSLEAMDAVGVVLSPPILFGHARTQPLAGLLPLTMLADILASDAFENVGLAFLSVDRLEGRFAARMHELDRSEPREEVIDRIGEHARAVGLEPVLIGGVYDLQRELGELIGSSLRVGLGGLLLLFLIIAFVLTRSAPTAGAMLLCLVGIPLMVLGAFGHLRIPIDMITSPAANVALAMGVDSMIHLVIRAGALGDWGQAQIQMKQPILAGTMIICLGFGIFAFSSFPPTARFGFAVILGTLTAATMALWVLPTVAQRWGLAGRASA